ncbi:MAG TPA: DUF5947 family protein, partial [Pirellulales bacterium]
ELSSDHEHLIESATRQLHCVCHACAILFGHQSSQNYRRVPHRVEELRDFRLTDAEWSGLGIPIGLAFFMTSSETGRVMAIYPSPGGPIESLLRLDSWDDLGHNNPVLGEFEPDVEALLVNRIGDERSCFRAPIDECYKLVGLMRRHWHGFSGGDEVWNHVGQFFAALRERS